VQRASGSHSFQIVFYFFDPPGDPPPVGFELSFARAAGSDSAAQTGHFRASSGKARQQVIELCQFHLQAAFPRPGAGGKDVQNELGAIDHLRVERLFQVALLGRCQVLVEDDRIDVPGLYRGRDFDDFAAAEKSRGFRGNAGLNDTVGDVRTSAGCEFCKLFE
jgi:hypothetical protein